MSDYYRGDLNNPEDLKRINRQPWAKTVLRGDIAEYVSSDDEMLILSSKLGAIEEKITVLENILNLLRDGADPDGYCDLAQRTCTLGKAISIVETMKVIATM